MYALHGVLCDAPLRAQVLAALSQHTQYIAVDMLLADAQQNTTRGDDHFWVSLQASRTSVCGMHACP